MLSRFSQIQPKVVFSVEAVSYNLKTHDHLGKLKEVVNKLEEVEHVVVIPFVNNQQDIDIGGVKNGMFLDDFLDGGCQADGSVPELTFEQVKRELLVVTLL